MSGTLSYHLAVVRGFGPYVVGDRITEASTIAAILAGPHYFRVVKVPVSGGATDGGTTTPPPATGGTGGTGATGPAGPAGAGIASAAVNASGQLVFTRTDGVTLAPITLPASAGGAAGPAGASVLTGSGAPAAATGANGESYIDTASFDFYKKSAGAWAKLGNIRGAAGAAGATGPAGPQGPAGPAGASATVTDPSALPLFAGNFGDADHAIAMQGGNLVRLPGATLKAFLTGTTAATPTPVAPGQVTGLTAGTATTTTMPLTWTAPTTGDTPFTYIVEYRVGTAAYTVANSAVSATSYTVTGLVASTVYEFRVTAKNAAGTGTPSATVSKGTAAAAATAPTAAPALTLGTPTASSVPVTVGAVSGADAAGYRIEYKASSASAWTVFTSTANAGAAVNVTGLASGTGYDFRASASSGGAFGPNSTVASATTSAAAAVATAILDGKPAPSFAYGFARLLTSHTGGAVVVAPTGSATETTIGFTADGSLDEAALSAVGADVELVAWVSQVAGVADLRVPAASGVRPKLVVGGAIQRMPGTGNRPGALFSNGGATGSWAQADGIDAGSDDVTVIAVSAPRAADATANETNATHYVLGLRPVTGAPTPPTAVTFASTESIRLISDASATRIRGQRGPGSGSNPTPIGVAIVTSGTSHVSVMEIEPAATHFEDNGATWNASGATASGFTVATTGPLTSAGRLYVGGTGPKAETLNGHINAIVGVKGLSVADKDAIAAALKSRVGA